MWKRADTRTLIACVPDAARRKQLARYIEHVAFFDHEVMWHSANYSCPEFPNVRTLQLYRTSLCASGPSQLVTFLSPCLRELSIWTQSDEVGQPIRRHGDNVWVSRLPTTCTRLSVLNLETVLDVSSTDLAAFFRAMSQLRVLRLGRELNPLLNREVVSAILVLPKLERLSMYIPLHQSFVQDFVGSRSPAVIMPSITNLEIAFLNGHTLATATLLDGMSVLEELTLTIRSTDEEETAPLDPAFFSVVVALPSISSVDVRLAASTTFPCHGLAVLAAHLNYLNISRIKEDFGKGDGHIQLTADGLLSSPMNIKFLEALESLNVLSPIHVTHNEATAIIHKVMAVSPYHVHLFDLVVDETTSFGWPSAEDWQSLWDSSEPGDVSVGQGDIVWRATAKAFAPDPVKWSSRDLNIYTGRDGEVLPLDRVVTEGGYNHLYRSRLIDQSGQVSTLTNNERNFERAR